MKYLYAYKSSDGVRHEETMDAPSREIVFQTLRERGIKAIKVIAADGSKANGEIRGIRKRVLAISILATAILAGLTVYVVLRTQRQPFVPDYQSDISHSDAAPELPRQQIPELHCSPENIFSSPAERFLVNFAQPAQPVSNMPSIMQPLADDLMESIENPIVLADDDTEAVKKLKGVVVGLKQEAKRIIQSGRSPAEAIRYFIDRQKMEEEHRKRIIDQVLTGEISKEAANSMFQTMSFQPID